VRRAVSVLAVLIAVLGWSAAPALAQGDSPGQPAAAAANGARVTPAGVVPPPGYVIGPDDRLSIVFWREKDLSADVAVRPDGRISLPLINEVQAAGLTPDELRVSVTEAAGKYVTDPTPTVVVLEINSRKVFITGEVAKPGPYPLVAPTTVLQLIATAGGLREYADSKNIRILRTEKGHPVSYRFNYNDVSQGKYLGQNIELKPGDTIVVR
jgi:polysaccharide export outer membrane protein